MSTSEQKEPYAEYFRRKPAGIPAETLRAIEKGPHSHALVLPLEDINALLSPGYLDIETGFCNMPDGSVYVAVKTEMPKVTGDMLDWWFWWHPMQSLRYKIWFPQAHFSVSLDADLEEYSKRSGPYAERYWNTANFPREDVGAGAETLSIKFVRPSDFGFDESRFEKAGVATVFCGLVGSKSKHVKQHTLMCHFVRNVDEGVEMRSRFWIGKKILVYGDNENSPVNRLANTKLIRKIAIPKNIGRSMAMHCAQEYNNLAEILPELYRAYA
ncbi:DAPG hydrolase family protein [Desulfatibacillum aliphaticivorans]|uniref:DAPG hydrolase family protein n=1 Tax=Desulfatibacillum aliphaticivorans TaxID=218208 RepID=UPI000424BDD3|nr:hypothetical protein [Desulfatibacillum aliphaticivorans]